MQTTRSTEHDLELRRLDELHAWDRNPKRHDVELIIKSLRLYGLVRPPAVNVSNDKLLYGHGLAEALITMRDAGEERPRRVEADDEGAWLVPTHMVDLEEPLHEPYLVVDNRATELGGWDREILPSILADIADQGYLEASGFSAEDLEAITGRFDVDILDASGDIGGGEFETMTFVLHTTQGDVVRQALREAKDRGAPSEVNTNANGNAIAAIARWFIDG